MAVTHLLKIFGMDGGEYIRRIFDKTSASIFPTYIHVEAGRDTVFPTSVLSKYKFLVLYKDRKRVWVRRVDQNDLSRQYVIEIDLYEKRDYKLDYDSENNRNELTRSRRYKQKEREVRDIVTYINGLILKGYFYLQDFNPIIDDIIEWFKMLVITEIKSRINYEIAAANALSDLITGSAAYKSYRKAGEKLKIINRGPIPSWVGPFDHVHPLIVVNTCIGKIYASESEWDRTEPGLEHNLTLHRGSRNIMCNAACHNHGYNLFSSVNNNNSNSPNTEAISLAAELASAELASTVESLTASSIYSIPDTMVLSTETT